MTTNLVSALLEHDDDLMWCVTRHNAVVKNFFGAASFYQKWRECYDSKDHHRMHTVLEKVAVADQQAILATIDYAHNTRELATLIITNIHHDEVELIASALGHTPAGPILIRIVGMPKKSKNMIEELVLYIRQVEPDLVRTTLVAIRHAVARIATSALELAAQILPGDVIMCSALMRILEIPYSEYTRFNVNTTGRWVSYGNLSAIRGWFHGHPTVDVRGGDSDVTYTIRRKLGEEELAAWLNL